MGSTRSATMGTTFGRNARKAVGCSALAVSLLAASVAQAGHADSYYAWVDVVDVDPIVRVDYVDEPVEHCVETRSRSSYRSSRDRVRSRDRDRYRDDYRQDDRGRANPGAVVLGGVLGGLLGNQFGGGNGKRALTVAGAVLGASIAANASSRSASQRSSRRDRSDWRDEPVRRCEISYEQRRVEHVDGYEVVYRYGGRRFTKVVDDHPGDRMRVRVDVQPV